MNPIEYLERELKRVSKLSNGLEKVVVWRPDHSLEYVGTFKEGTPVGAHYLYDKTSTKSFYFNLKGELTYTAQY